MRRFLFITGVQPRTDQLECCEAEPPTDCGAVLRLGNRQRAADFFEYLARQLRADRLVSVSIEMPARGVGHGSVVLRPTPTAETGTASPPSDFGDPDERATLPGFPALGDDKQTHVHVTFDEDVTGDGEL